MDLRCSFLVVRRGKPSARSKRIWRPKTLRVPVPVRSPRSLPFSSMSRRRSRYCFMVSVGSFYYYCFVGFGWAYGLALSAAGAFCEVELRAAPAVGEDGHRQRSVGAAPCAASAGLAAAIGQAVLEAYAGLADDEAALLAERQGHDGAGGAHLRAAVAVGGAGGGRVVHHGLEGVPESELTGGGPQHAGGAGGHAGGAGGAAAQVGVARCEPGGQRCVEGFQRARRPGRTGGCEAPGGCGRGHYYAQAQEAAPVHAHRLRGGVLAVAGGGGGARGLKQGRRQAMAVAAVGDGAGGADVHAVEAHHAARGVDGHVGRVDAGCLADVGAARAAYAQVGVDVGMVQRITADEAQRRAYGTPRRADVASAPPGHGRHDAECGEGHDGRGYADAGDASCGRYHHAAGGGHDARVGAVGVEQGGQDGESQGYAYAGDGQHRVAAAQGGRLVAIARRASAAPALQGHAQACGDVHQRAHGACRGAVYTPQQQGSHAPEAEPHGAPGHNGRKQLHAGGDAAGAKGHGGRDSQGYRRPDALPRHAYPMVLLSHDCTKIRIKCENRVAVPELGTDKKLLKNRYHPKSLIIIWISIVKNHYLYSRINHS